MAKPKLKPGEVASASGLYEILGPRGGHTGKERTVSKGETLPPTPRPGERYRMSVRTRNKSGRG